MEDNDYALEDFDVGELVLSKNVNRKEPWWPAIVLDPLKEAPGTIRRQMQPDRLCVMFYGPPANKKRPRDFCWAKEGDVLPLIGHLEQLQSQNAARKERGSIAFQAAIEEVLLVERGLQDALTGASEDDFEGAEGASDTPGCSSCCIPLNQNEIDNAEPHDGRCGSCQRLYEEKNYCPVCNKVWLPNEKNMVGCDSCTFWVHSHCDPAAAKALKASGDDIYHCPACKKKRSAKSRLAELRKAEEDVCKHQPRRPRSAYNLFAAEIHQQYNSDNGMRIDFKDMARVVGETWRQLTPKERAPYEALARQETVCYEKEKRVHEDKQRHYTSLYHQATAAGLLAPDEVPAPSPSTASKAMPLQEEARAGDDKPSKAAAALSKPASAEEARKIVVMCNGYRGVFLLGLQRVICLCNDCKKKPEADREFSCTQYEQHCGAGAAKKWKASLRIEPGSVPEVPEGSAPMQVGKWLDQQGIDVKPSARPIATPALPLLPAHRATEKLLAAVYAPWNDTENNRHKPVKVRWAGDRCTVCDSDVDYEQDQLVSCDMCAITVHQSCYGVQELPGEDDMWLCRACELKDESKQPQCCLCPVEGGALKPTTEPGLWCHATCLQWIPEVSVGDDRRMEPVTHIKSIQKERWELNCCVCKQRVGAKIQCNNCYTAYHPLCARMAGLYMNMVDGSDGQEDGAVRLISYCPKHCTPHPELAGLQLVKEGEEVESEDDTNGLWNGQPFRPQPAVPLPDPSAGCARAQSLQGWERASHGTGMGHTTNKGFWIPEKPLAPPAEALLALPELARSRPLKPHSRAAAVPKPRKRLSSRPPKEIKMETEEELDEEPPQAVELVPLPEGVPEVLPITCNGRSGVLLVRTQRVQHSQAEMSASKFEQVCGKGDAKKWKSSIWLEAPDASQLMMMQDWLAMYKLDRKALAALAGNAQAVQSWQDYLQMTVQDVMEDMLSVLEPPAAEDQDAAMTEEDKPEQELSKLDVAAAAPIKHEHHMEGADEQPQLHTAGDRAQVPVKAEQATGSAEQQGTADAHMIEASAHMAGATVRMTDAGAEVDALQHEHPAQLQTPFDPQSGPAMGPYGSPPIDIMSISRTSQHPPTSQRQAQQAELDLNSFATEVVDRATNVQQPVKRHDRGHAAAQGSNSRKHHPQGAVPVKTEANAMKGMTDLGDGGSNGAVQQAGGVHRQAMEAEPSAAHLASSSPRIHPAQQHVKAEPMDVDTGAGVGVSGSHHAQTGSLEHVPQRKRSRSQDLQQDVQVKTDSKRQKTASEETAGVSAEVPRDKPQAWVGRHCRIFWPDDDEWYEAAVRAYDDRIGRHNVWYFYDEEGEWLDLAAEVDAKHVIWLQPILKSKPPQLHAQHNKPQTPAPNIPPASLASTALPSSAPSLSAAPSNAAMAASHQVFKAAPISGLPPTASSSLPPTAIRSLPPAAGSSLLPEPSTLVQTAAATTADVSAAPPPASGSSRAPQGKAAVGHQVAIWWPDDFAWYNGRIQGFQAAKGEHLVHYDDNEVEWLNLAKERVHWKDLPGQPMLPDAPPTAVQPPSTAAAAPVVEIQPAEQAVTAVEPDAPAVPRGPVPDTVPIVCNNSRAVFDVKRTCVLLGEGRECTPTEFERLAGKGASKKWKASIRVDKGGGVPGPTMGDWLIDAGLDSAKAVRPKPPPSMQAARRQQPARQQYGAQTAKPSGKQAHRDGCMCIICKQARRVGKTWGGMNGVTPWQTPMLTQGPQGRPTPRFGKRAFLHAMPQLVCGALKHKVWRLPQSTAWKPSDWLAAKGHKPAEEGTSSDAPEASAGTAGVKVEGGRLSRQGSASTSGPAVSDPALPKPAAKLAEGKAVSERKGLTMKERLKICQQTERRRITFGKSGIHGWGLIAKAEMKQDSMVVEYRGDLLRPKMSDDRQKYYNRVGKDCYLFNVNDDVVIDATMSGAIGRFTNHCCAPSMYTKVVEVEGESRLVFFARTDIKPGQELTYDYRFKEEEGDDKVQCKCGAPNCRGTLN